MAELNDEQREYFDEIRQRAAQLTETYAARDRLYEDVRQMFHMEWKDKPPGDWIKETMSPSAFNATIGAVRLLTATEPQFSVPFEEADGQARAQSDKIEKAARAMWAGAGRVAGRPVHHDLVLSGLLFSEMCASVTQTAGLVKYAEKSGDPGNLARMKAVARRTPYLFRVYNPAGCYPELDGFGLRALLRRHETTWGEVRAAWGQAAELALGQGLSEAAVRTWDANRKVVVNDWYDWLYRAVWLEEASEPVVCEVHGLEFLPVVAQVAEGSNLFDRPELNRFPFLYSVLKSGLWNRENLMLTVVYSQIHAIGSYPLLLRKTNTPGSQLIINRTNPSGTVDIPLEESLTPLVENVVDAAQWRGLELAQGYNEQSTISRTTLGAQPEHPLAYSAISLLAQSGRLPLLAAQGLGGVAIADLVTIALNWLKADRQAVSMYRRGRKIELAPADIPEDVPLECSLEPALPQDRGILADVAERLNRSALASRRWIRENLLNIGQSQSMEKEIAREQFATMMTTGALQRLAQELESALAGQQAGAPGQPAAPQMGPTPGPAQGGPPAAYPEGGVRPGMPMQGPLPGPLEQQGQAPPVGGPPIA